MNEPSDAPNISSRRDQYAMLMFVLGLVVGGLIVLAISVFRGTQLSDSTALRAALRDELSALDFKELAKQGMMEAIREDQQKAQAELSTTDSDNNFVGPQQPIATSSSSTAGIQVALGNNILGDNNAPVVMIEYSDFQCPFCGRFNRSVYPILLEKYIKTGKVKFVYKHAAILGQESVWAGQASECAADQQKFWEYHNLVFQRQNGENQGAYSRENLIGFAGELKLDIKKFRGCLNDNKTLDRVQKDTDEGQRIGLRGTPHFLINGKAVVGAQPFEVFQTTIEQALQRE